MEDCHYLLIFEEVLFQWKLKLWVVIGATFFLLQRSLLGHLYSHCLFSFGLVRLGCVSSFVVDPPFVSYLSLFHKLFLGISFNSFHTNFYLIKKVMPTCLEQHGQGYMCRAHKRKVTESLNVVPNGLFTFLNRREELVHGHLSIILVKSSKKLSF